ncbi:sigma-54-dependent transcriptional regulator [Luteolibacter sp. AS25]|uniref:sigma-54-dependent transcriptional regulator n=1 Tax=Luteolibacter sp. AS25 TaxID=3135776 RepID=UPI00398ABAF0
MSQSKPNLLLVDDDETILRLLSMAAKENGWRPITAGSGHEALEIIDANIEAVVLDLGLPGIDGIDTIGRLHNKFPGVPIVMLTGTNDAETAVQTLKAGATDYLTKPFEIDRLFELLRESVNNRSTASKTKAPAKNNTRKVSLETSSPRMKVLFRQLQKAAKLNSTILLSGESGTGKTYIARQIHQLSDRSSESFITVSCPALPRELLETELFGHEKGAFTGASSSRIGRFEQASEGTIFLDEIGDLPSELQPKLLNVLQDREFFRIGGNRLLKTNARVIAATNVDLRSRVTEGSFREDLYYRLNIIELHIPPLRERKEDIPSIISRILSKIAANRGTDTWTLTPAALEAVQNFNWPGNIRQLENVLERATAFSEGSVIEAEDVIDLLDSPPSSTQTAQIFAEPGLTLHEIEREAFIQTYIRTGKNKAKTARELGISERSVYNLMGRHGLK